ncbi:MAG TPA: hypothetical protein PLV92_25940, partial [Pirellulaceae bacterium]|nr:hypothetical protein [Pirellulaceae bacterium]
MLRRWFLEKLFSHLDCRGRVRAAVAGTLVVSFGIYACSPPAKPPVATSPVSNVLRSDTAPTDIDKLLETLAKLPRRSRRKTGDSGRTTSADQQSTAKVSTMKDLRLLIARRIGMPWSELEARCAEAVQKSKEHADWKFEFPIADELRAMIAQKRTQFDKFNDVQRKTIEDADASLAAFLASGKKLQALQGHAKTVFGDVRDNVERITAEISRIEALEEAGKPVEEELNKLLDENGIVAAALDDLESDRAVLETLAHALQASRDELQAAAEALKATLKVLAEVH